LCLFGAEGTPGGGGAAAGMGGGAGGAGDWHAARGLDPPACRKREGGAAGGVFGSNGSSVIAVSAQSDDPAADPVSAREVACADDSQRRVADSIAARGSNRAAGGDP